MSDTHQDTDVATLEAPPLPPMVRHVVDIGPNGDKVPDTTLCGEPYDTLNIRPNGTLCDGCKDELKKRGHWRGP